MWAELEPDSAQKAASSGRWLRRLAIASVLTVPPLALLIALRAYRAEAAVFVPSRHAVPRSAALGMPATLIEVFFASQRGDTVRGWYLPARNRAAIALCHGSGADRTDLLREAAFLHARGFGVLLYDSPGHGESTGEVHWSEGENRALEAALRFLAQRPEVDGERIGVYGFSMGGYVAALVSARNRRVRAVALAGTPPDAERHTRWEYRRWGPISQLPALWAVARGGIDLSGPMPIDVVAQIAPRPLLIIGGDQDTIVPPHMTKELFFAAREPKQLLVIEGAGHGGYDAVASGGFFAALGSFFARALSPLEPCHDGQDPDRATADTPK